MTTGAYWIFEPFKLTHWAPQLKLFTCLCLSVSFAPAPSAPNYTLSPNLLHQIMHYAFEKNNIMRQLCHQLLWQAGEKTKLLIFRHISADMSPFRKPQEHRFRQAEDTVLTWHQSPCSQSQMKDYCRFYFLTAPIRM